MDIHLKLCYFKNLHYKYSELYSENIKYFGCFVSRYTGRMFCGRTFCVRTFNVQDLSYSLPFEAAPFVAGLLEPNLSSEHLLNVKSAHSRTDVHVHFSSNKYPIYTHDGASAKFGTN